MTSFQNPQSRLPLLLRFAERLHSASLQFRNSFDKWVRQHIVDDDPYEMYGTSCPLPATTDGAQGNVNL